MNKTDEGDRFEKVQKQKVDYFKPLIASLMYFYHWDHQEAILGVRKSGKWICPGGQEISESEWTK